MFLKVCLTSAADENTCAYRKKANCRYNQWHWGGFITKGFDQFFCPKVFLPIFGETKTPAKGLVMKPKNLPGVFSRVFLPFEQNAQIAATGLPLWVWHVMCCNPTVPCCLSPLHQEGGPVVSASLAPQKSTTLNSLLHRSTLLAWD